VAALPMWIQFMDKFLKDKPNDQFPKAPPPDREIVARQNEARRRVAEAEAKEAETQATDESADKAKSASQEDTPAAGEPAAAPPSTPRMVQPEGGLPPRIDRTPPRTDRPRTDERNPGRPPGDEPKPKRGKNG
jgi:membrane carboxypeptidase/penicillin-binding protein